MEFQKEIRKRMIDRGVSLKDIPGASKSSWSKWIRDPYSARLIDIIFLLRFLGYGSDEAFKVIEKLIEERT